MQNLSSANRRALQKGHGLFLCRLPSAGPSMAVLEEVGFWGPCGCCPVPSMNLTPARDSPARCSVTHAIICCKRPSCLPPVLMATGPPTPSQDLQTMRSPGLRNWWEAQQCWPHRTAQKVHSPGRNPRAFHLHNMAATPAPHPRPGYPCEHTPDPEGTGRDHATTVSPKSSQPQQLVIPMEFARSRGSPLPAGYGQ